MYETILVPTDGSDEMTEAVLPHAATLARTYDATLHALYVIDARTVATLPDDSHGAIKRTLLEEGYDAYSEFTDLLDDIGIEY